MARSDVLLSVPRGLAGPRGGSSPGRCLEPLLRRDPRQGRRWNDHRMVINGVFFRTRPAARGGICRAITGTGRRGQPAHCRWSGDGTREKVLDGLRAGCDAGAGEAWTAAIDATVIRAHQHAAGARHAPPGDIDPARVAPAELSAPSGRGAAPNDKNPPAAGDELGKQRDREALGRSRGGLTTKIHLAADSSCRPLAQLTSAGQRHDSLAFIPLMGQLRIAGSGPGRPRIRPGRVLADERYAAAVPLAQDEFGSVRPD